MPWPLRWTSASSNSALVSLHQQGVVLPASRCNSRARSLRAWPKVAHLRPRNLLRPIGVSLLPRTYSKHCRWWHEPATCQYLVHVCKQQWAYRWYSWSFWTSSTCVEWSRSFSQDSSAKGTGHWCTHIRRIRSRRSRSCGSLVSDQSGLTVIIVLQAINKFEMKSWVRQAYVYLT